MSETSRRVNVTLTIPTVAATADVLADVAMVVRDHSGYDVEATSVHAFTLDEDDKPEPSARLVFRDGALYSVHIDDPEGAEGRALEVQGVVMEVPVVADYRLKEAL